MMTSNLTLDTATLDAIMEAAMKATHAPGAALAVVTSDVVYVQGYGVRKIGETAPVTPDTLFACASTTKAFTTAALGLLVDENKMAWDDLVRKHLPAFRLADPLADANVTLRDLVTHRTGLPRHDMLWYGSAWTPDEILRRVAHAPASESFRAKYQYQNICFLAAGEAVRAASGAASFPDFVRDRLLVPLVMDSTTFSVEAAQKSDDFATPHRREKGKTKTIPWRNMDNGHALGGLNASADNLSHWLRFLLAGGTAPNGERLLSETNLREMWTPQMVMPLDEETRILYPDTVQVSYGLGWSIRDYRGGHKLVSHGGAIDGFRANVAVIPERGIGVAVLTNSAPSYLPEIVRNHVLDVLLGLPARDWGASCLAWQKKTEGDAKKKEAEKKAARKPKTSPSRPLSAYAGNYENAAYGMATIAARKKGIEMTWNQTVAPLRHFNFDTFAAHPPSDAPWDKSDILFSLDAMGEVVSLTFLGAVFRKAAPSKP